MYCNQCGRQIAEGSNFCTACGAPVGEPITAQAPSSPSQTPAAQPSTPTQPQLSGFARLLKWAGISFDALWLLFILSVAAFFLLVLLLGIIGWLIL